MWFSSPACSFVYGLFTFVSSKRRQHQGTRHPASSVQLCPCLPPHACAVVSVCLALCWGHKVGWRPGPEVMSSPRSVQRGLASICPRRGRTRRGLWSPRPQFPHLALELGPASLRKLNREAVKRRASEWVWFSIAPVSCRTSLTGLSSAPPQFPPLKNGNQRLLKESEWFSETMCVKLSLVLSSVSTGWVVTAITTSRRKVWLLPEEIKGSLLNQRDQCLLFLVGATWRGPEASPCPLCPSSLASLVVSQRFFFITAIWLRFKGSCAPRGKGWAGSGGQGHFHWGEDFPHRRLSGQGRALYWTEQLMHESRLCQFYRARPLGPGFSC